MRPVTRFGTLESRFYLTFSGMIFIIILAMQVTSTQYTISTVRGVTSDNKAALLSELVTQIDGYIAEMERITGTVLDDEDVREYLSAAPELRDDELGRRIEDRLEAYVQARTDLSSVILFPSEGPILSGVPGYELADWVDFRRAPWYTEALDRNGRTVVSTAYVQNLLEGRYAWVVSLSTEIISSQDGSSLGVLLVDLKFNRIKELCDALVMGEKGYNFIIDDNGNYIFHPSQQLVYSGIKNEPVLRLRQMIRSGSPVLGVGDKTFMTAYSGSTGWHVVSVSFESDIFTGRRVIPVVYAIIGLVLFFLVGWVTTFISKRITRPVYQLQSVMRSVETGEFRQAGPIEGTEEIRELAREYDLMVSRIGELMEANIREQELKRKSDLKALQAQINPHFLYNTLDSIIWMGEMDKSEEVVKMTSALSRLFRISISKGREIIPLRDELEHVRSYLTILEMRYKDKFRYLIDVPESLLDQKILKITLQPLVENAIYHGIRSMDYEGRIDITGAMEEDALILRVRDNGQGMDPEALHRLLADPPPEEADRRQYSRQGMGVRNVQERIRLYFGWNYGLSYQSRKGSGTEITIRLPRDAREEEV